MKLLFATLLLAAGCATDGATEMPGSDSPEAGAPRINVLLTDAPGDFEKVWVTISTVEVAGAAGWQTITDVPQTFDLLTLQNDVTAALGGSSLEPGTYGQLRLIVDEASVVIDGTESPLKIASGAETGIKIGLDATFEADMTYSITLDFDAHKSIKSTGNGHLMTPVIFVKEVIATPTTTTGETPLE